MGVSSTMLSTTSLHMLNLKLLKMSALSKSRSLAGLRVGFAMGHVELVEALDRVKNSFNSYPLGALAQVGAVAALGDRDHFEKTRQWVIDGRDELIRELRSRGFRVLPSVANFVFASHSRLAAKTLVRELRSRLVIVRHFEQALISNFLRISVGTPAQQARFYDVLDDTIETLSD